MSSRPIVLLHGFTGQRESWDGVLAALSIDTRADVTALPIGGHHLGPPCAGSWKENVALLAEQVAAATESRPADIVGYSLGARLSLGLLAEYPELIATLTLISVNPGLETRHQRHQRRHDDRTWITLCGRAAKQRLSMPGRPCHCLQHKPRSTPRCSPASARYDSSTIRTNWHSASSRWAWPRCPTTAMSCATAKSDAWSSARETRSSAGLPATWCRIATCWSFPTAVTTCR